MTRLDKQMEFIREMDKLKHIVRQTYLADGSRKENDTEHSWHLAIMCMLLQEHSNERIDVLRAMYMVLTHDVIEIDAGDTYAYDEEGNQSKREREVRAAERIFTILPKDQEQFMRGLWDEFEEGITPEARFAASLDRIQPVMLNDAAGGKAWTEHGVRLSQVLERNGSTADGSKELWEYARKQYIETNLKKKTIIAD